MSIIQKPVKLIEPSTFLTEDKLRQLTDPNAFRGMPCGIDALDQITYGIKPGLYIFSAVRGTGKSWFALQLARGLWESSQVKSLFFTLEMTVDQLLQRCLQSWSGLTEEEYRAQKSTAKGETLLKDNFLQIVAAYEDSFDYNTFEAAIQLGVTQGIKVFILDHLHLIKGASTQDSLNVLADFANEAKKLAAKLDVVIWIIAQPRKLNSLSKVVTSDDIKGSGAIVDAADVVITASRERKDPKEEASREVWFSVEKNRLGGKMYQGVPLLFRETGEFVEIIHPYKDREEQIDALPY